MRKELKKEQDLEKRIRKCHSICRMFVWNLEEGRVTEQMVVTIPATPGNLFPGLNVQNRSGGVKKTRKLVENFGDVHLVTTL